MESPNAATTLISPGLSSWTAKQIKLDYTELLFSRLHDKNMSKLTILLFYLRWVFQEMVYGQCRASLCPLPVNTQHFNIHIFYFCVSLINTALWWRTYSICCCRGFLFSHHGGVAHCAQERSLLEWRQVVCLGGFMKNISIMCTSNTVCIMWWHASPV